MEQVNEAQPQSQPPSQRFYALEQLGELAGTITLISEGLQAYRAQVAGLLAGQKKAEAFELYRLLERQRTYLVEQIRATRPFLMELENPLAPAAQKLAEQLAAFPLMTADYSKLTEVLKRFADALPDHQTTDASIIGRLMNNVRLGHYPTDLTHVGYIANSIVFPAENTANLIDPCCGTGDALLRLALGTDSQCYGIELDDHRAEQAQQQLYRVGFGSFFGSNISPGAFHAVFLNPPYLSVLSENGGRSRDEKRFLIESIPLLMMGGLLIYIVPYDNLVSDPFIDPLPYCMEAQRLFELYQNCAGRRQIETLLENYVDSMQAVKIGRGHFFFVPRDFAARLQVFEDFVEMLEEHNQLKRPDRDPLEVNSIYVVDDAKQRKKMTAAFYRSVRREIAEYEERVTHLIQSGSQSPKIMDRWVMRIQGLEEKKRNYENILKRELTDLDEEFTSLRYLSDELRIRAAGLRVHQKAA